MNSLTQENNLLKWQGLTEITGMIPPKYPSIHIAALIVICPYCMVFWGLFVTELIVLDLLLIVKSQNHLKQKFLMKWLIISVPFIY